MTHSLDRISGPKGFYFPLPIVRREPLVEIRTYDPPSLSKILGGTTTQFPRVFMDINIAFGVKVLDLVDPCLQFSVFEDG